MKIGYRRQWTGIPEAPKTGYVVAHGKIGVKKRSFHGIGMLVDNDVAGPFSTTSMFANYAFHLKLNRSYTLASGIGIGFSQYRVNYGAMIMEFQNADPAINGTVNNFIFPQINAGLWLYKPNQFYGFSVRQIKPNDIKGLGDSKLTSHFTFVYGKAIKVSDDLSFKPAFLVNYAAKSKASIEGQALLSYKERFTMGLAARSGNGISALAKFDILKRLTLAYAYDLTASKLRFDGVNTHEVTLGLRACEFDEAPHIPCAAYD